MGRRLVRISAVVVALAIVVLGMTAVTTYAKPDKWSWAARGDQDRGRAYALPVLPPKPIQAERLWPTRLIELSEGFRARVWEILKANDTTRSLLDEGYNVTVIRPYIKLVVQADGSVTFKVAEVWVTLYKRGEGVVHVLVDYANGRVLRVWGLKPCACPCVCGTTATTASTG